MVETAEPQPGWEGIPSALADVARRSGISAAELLAFRDDPANQDSGLPDLDDHEWELITAPGDDGPVRVVAPDGSRPPGPAPLPAVETIDEPDADDHRCALARLAGLRERVAGGADPDRSLPRRPLDPERTVGASGGIAIARDLSPADASPADAVTADELPADELPAGVADADVAVAEPAGSRGTPTLRALRASIGDPAAHPDGALDPPGDGGWVPRCSRRPRTTRGVDRSGGLAAAPARAPPTPAAPPLPSADHPRVDARCPAPGDVNGDDAGRGTRRGDAPRDMPQRVGP